MALSLTKIFNFVRVSLSHTLHNQKVCCRSIQSLGYKEDLSQFDPVQVKLLDEMCIAVDENDNVLGPRTKKECHLMENINKGLQTFGEITAIAKGKIQDCDNHLQGLLHRAFSVFLFNMKGELLLQRRSDAKITFPGYYTNTCCSHPLYIDSELEEIKALGVKRAAQRRLGIELGIDPASVPAEDFLYMTRILYTAPSDHKWGEREIDYVLIIQKDVDLDPNPNEVKECVYVGRNDLKGFLDGVKNKGYKVTPWFQLIAEAFLPKYWDNLDKLKPLRDHKKIYTL